ncbi:hypothetical protein [Hymenobacter busanensis]|nr:hypothetical protein [Hymenobacter busanensis]QHJ08297.1 hypothetical protein GUY19_13755 [Hymenobacter busanensis]
MNRRKRRPNGLDGELTALPAATMQNSSLFGAAALIEIKKYQGGRVARRR